MATIYNSDLSKELVDGARIQQNRDIIPNQLAEKVVPVMEVNPKLLRRINLLVGGTSTTTGTKTIYTTLTDRETFLTGFSISFIKDVTCDSATGSYLLTAVINGTTVNLSSMAIITLTAQSSLNNYTFAHPIKLDKGTAISFTGSFTAGVCSRGFCINGYTVENNNA